MDELTKVDKIMVRIYANLIKKGERTLESVPEKLRDYVGKGLKGA